MAQTVNLKMYASSGYYFVNASESDQGIAGAGATVKDIVDAVGTSRSATIVFGHTGAGNTTTYTFSTSETIPSNFDVIVENGAIIAMDTGITLTMQGSLTSVPLQQWISLAGTGKVDFSSGAYYDEVYVEWWGAARDNTTDDVAAFDAALAAIGAGTIKLLEGTYMLDTVFELYGVGKRLMGQGSRGTFLNTPIDNNDAVIDIGTSSNIADNCSVSDLGIYRAAGTPAASDNGINVENCTDSWVENLRIFRQQHGIDIDAHDDTISTVVGFKVLNCRFDDVTSAYVRVADCDQTSLIGNTFGRADETLDMQHCVRIENLADNLLIANNTFVPGDDSSPDNGITIDTYTGSGTFITIVGNQFSTTTNTFNMTAVEGTNLTITGNKFDSALIIRGSSSYLIMSGNKLSAPPTLTGSFTRKVISGNVIEHIAASSSGAIGAGQNLIELNSNGASLTMTIAAPEPGRYMTITQIDAGTDGHTVTLTAGTFDGTNNRATFNAQGEAIILQGISTTAFVLLANQGSVGMSSV